MALSGITTPDQSGPESNGNEGVLRIPQSSSITGTSPSDCLVSYSGHSLEGRVLPLSSGAVGVFYDWVILLWMGVIIVKERIVHSALEQEPHNQIRFSVILFWGVFLLLSLCLGNTFWYHIRALFLGVFYSYPSAREMHFGTILEHRFGECLPSSHQLGRRVLFCLTRALFFLEYLPLISHLEAQSAYS